MAVKENQLAQRQKFSVVINTDNYKKLIANTLQDPERSRRFVASITSAVAVNPALQECLPSTIVAGALLGESLNLSPSPQLGQYYLVPFKQKEKKDKKGNIVEPACTKAQFILGYKGYLQLAIRSGQYKKLNVVEIKEGELKRFNPLTEEVEVEMIEDYEVREKAPTIGYYAFYEYLNGFTKAIYWSKSKMIAHADKYSAAFSALNYKKLEAGKVPEEDLWKYSSFWYKNFDEMAKKTMLRHLISRWGIMSIELQDAFANDETFKDFVDGEIVSSEDASDFETVVDNSEMEVKDAEPETVEAAEVSLDDL